MKKYFAKLMLLPAFVAIVAGLGCKSSEANLPPAAGVNLTTMGATIQTDPKGNVIEMDLTAKPVGNGDLAAIARHLHLQTLWLTKTGVTDAGLADLQPLRQLRVLGLARTGITDAGIRGRGGRAENRAAGRPRHLLIWLVCAAKPANLRLCSFSRHLQSRLRWHSRWEFLFSSWSRAAA